MGKRPNGADRLTEEEEELLWNSGVQGESTINVRTAGIFGRLISTTEEGTGTNAT